MFMDITHMDHVGFRKVEQCPNLIRMTLLFMEYHRPWNSFYDEFDNLPSLRPRSVYRTP